MPWPSVVQGKKTGPLVAAPVRMAVCEDEEPDEGFEVEFEE